MELQSIRKQPRGESGGGSEAALEKVDGIGIV